MMTLQKRLAVIVTAFPTRRGLLITAGIFAVLYAVIVLLYVQSLPDLGIRSAFGTTLNGPVFPFRGETPGKADVVVRVGDIPINHWADLLNAPFRLRERLNEVESKKLGG